MKTHSKYSWYAKNYGTDLIYYNRLRLVEKIKIDMSKTLNRRMYFNNAYLGILLID